MKPRSLPPQQTREQLQHRRDWEQRLIVLVSTVDFPHARQTRRYLPGLTNSTRSYIYAAIEPIVMLFFRPEAAQAGLQSTGARRFARLAKDPDPTICRHSCVAA